MGILKGKSVLIVEDTKHIRDQLKQLYESFGMSVTAEAENGTQALDLLEQNRFDLISLDIIMPEMNGIECYQEIMNAYPEQHCIFFTYLASDDLVMDNLRKIIPEVLIFKKNFKAEDIRPRIEEILSRQTIKIARAEPTQNVA